MSRINEHRKYSSIPIMKAVLSGNVAGVTEIIVSNASYINYSHPVSSDSPLIFAARLNQCKILKLLVEHGASLEQRNMDGKCVLHEVAYTGCMACLNLLLSTCTNADKLKRADWTPLMVASAQGHLIAVERLIHAGADIHRRNKDGWTCFHLACREGFTEVMKLLYNIDNSVSGTVSFNGRTPLHTAAMHGQLEASKFILETRFCDFDCEDSCGSSPLFDAFRFGFINIADLLINHAFSLNKVDKIGRHCFHVAAESNQLLSLEYLLNKCNIDVNIRCNGSRLSSAHLVAREGHIPSMKFLVERGVSLDCVDRNERTPFHLAVAANQMQMVKLLASLNCNQAKKDCDGKLAQDYALSLEMKEFFT